MRVAFLCGLSAFCLLLPATAQAQALPWTIEMRQVRLPTPGGDCGPIELVARDAEGKPPVTPDGKQVNWQDFDVELVQGEGPLYLTGNGRFLCAREPNAIGLIKATYPPKGIAATNPKARTRANNLVIPGVNVSATLDVRSIAGPTGVAARSGLEPPPPNRGMPTILAPAPAAGTRSSASSAVTGVSITQGSTGPLVTWNPIAGASYSVSRWKIDDPACCNSMSPPNPALSVPRWQDTALPMSGTYVYRVTAMTPAGLAYTDAQFNYGAPVAPVPAPTAVAATGLEPPPPNRGTPTILAPPGGTNTPTGTTASGTPSIDGMAPPPAGMPKTTAGINVLQSINCTVPVESITSIANLSVAASSDGRINLSWKAVPCPSPQYKLVRVIARDGQPLQYDAEVQATVDSATGLASTADPQSPGLFTSANYRVDALLPDGRAVSTQWVTWTSSAPSGGSPWTATTPKTPSQLAPAYLVGMGISDITGPAAEVVMMGYANPDQVSSGIHMRLYARAFIIASPAPSGRRIVFVSAELGQLFSSLKQGVLKKLAQRYGSLYNDHNVMISATHTHAGPGGYSHHAIFNMTSYGFVTQNYNAIVDGITEAIVQAHERLAPASLSYAAGNIDEQASANRSLDAYEKNKDFIQSNPSVNPEVSVLAIARDGRPAGVISWFSVHNTSLTRNNLMVSSDHKGWASYRFERRYGTVMPFQKPGEFVAAFANGDEGDLSPNIGPNWTGPGRGEFDSLQVIGNRELATAVRLFEGTDGRQVLGDIDFRHTFVKMPGYAVDDTNETNGVGGKTLCKAAYGMSFGAGAEDGRSGLPFVEGMKITADPAVMASMDASRKLWYTMLAPPLTVSLDSVLSAMNDPCHWPKPILFPTGYLGWSPDTLPFQLLRVGSVAIAGIPGEMTVQAGRRLRKKILEELGPIGVTNVVLAGLANEYSGYIATPEEYNEQQYEGASTAYGRLTLDAYCQIFKQLAISMAAGRPADPGPTPPDLGTNQIELQTGVVFDDKPLTETFGQVLLEPPATVTRSSQVKATFRAGHPKNDLRRNDTYIRVERHAGGDNWELVAWDSMPETFFVWRRVGTAYSEVDAVWWVPPDAQPGNYRIVHSGKWKNGWNQQLVPYQGVTRMFTIQ